MLPAGIIKSMDERRLGFALVLLFIALALPTAVLIRQAYGQLKWEAFHQHRGSAESLTRRIDAELGSRIRQADERSFADYAFLVVTGDPTANFVARSPLAAYPVESGLPGALGHFQVDSDGDFSTPLLPPSGSDPAQLGINADEYAARQQAAARLRSVLADNRLVRSRPDPDSFFDSDDAGMAGFSRREPADAVGYRERAAAPPEAPRRDSEGKSNGTLSSPTEAYSQGVFDRLNEVRADAPASVDEEAGLEQDAISDMPAQGQRRSPIAKVSELKLDADLQKKSEELERQDVKRELGEAERSYAAVRSKRREQTAVPEAVPPAESAPIANVSGLSDLRISTFESEVDPFQFSLLDSGHFVLFRNVWRDGERYIQGQLIDADRFLQATTGSVFLDTALARMSSLLVAFQNDVLRSYSGPGNPSYPDLAAGLDGELLYRNRLSAPLDSLELIFSVDHLPPGPGGQLLGWLTLVLAIVFAGGFVALYRLGLGQIRLARQQQDFVSAVSHELKTPLTSIRMYGEMLKEGWVDEEKRQSYYEFIHDESERLSRLIANVLQLARITRSDPQFDMQPVAAGSLLTSVESKIAHQVDRAGFELRITQLEDVRDVPILVDEDCFTQIIINLVDNAIKFAANAGEKVIEIGCRRMSDDRVQFSVRDFGPGVPDDQMKKIFELFYRSESELTRETVGTGIGLAIVHQLTVAMNGSVDLVDAQPGAEFRVTFPVAAK